MCGLQQERCDVGRGGELPDGDDAGDEKDRAEGGRGQHLLQPGGGHPPARGQSRQQRPLRDDDQHGDAGGGGEGEPPADEVAEELPGRQADDGTDGEAGQDDRRRSGALPLTSQAEPERRHHGPEAPDGDAEQHPGQQQDEERGGHPGDRVGQRDEHVLAVEVAGAEDHQRRGDGGAEPRNEDHQPRGAERDVHVGRDVRQEADRGELGRDDDLGAQGERQHAQPGAPRDPGRRAREVGIHGRHACANRTVGPRNPLVRWAL